MIKSLFIKNFILIDELKLNFENGYNAICGETGAGKSIIIRAIDAVLGAKAQKDLIKNDASALIEIEFETMSRCGVGTHQGGESGHCNVTISREITSSGSKFRINGAMVALDEVREKSENLIDIHSQHQTYTYLQKKFQIKLLDGYICSKNRDFSLALEKFEQEYNHLKKIKERIEYIENNNEQNLRQREFLKFQIDEIERAEILENEEVQLNEELEILSNINTLKETTYGIYWTLGGEDGSILEALSKIQGMLSKITSLDKGLGEVESAFIEGVENLKFTSSELRNYCENLSDNPARLDEISERLSLIEKLKRKYGNIEQALEKFKIELNEIEIDINELNDIKAKAQELESETAFLSQFLSDERKKYSEILSKQVTQELKKLELECALFEISIKEVKMNKSGIDDVEFLITTNASQSLAPLSKVASGGELSRVMLSIKSLFANSSTIIFDEIDTGISGKTSQAVAAAISNLADNVQVFAITHQPIIASRARAIYWVEKTQMQNNTTIQVSKLTGDQMAKALAQMASGEITQTSLTFVKDLLNS